MTRIAIVAASEQLRAKLATSLGANASFEIVSLAASTEDVDTAAEVVIVARDVRGSGTSGPAEAGDGLGGPALTNREREIIALVADGLGNKQIAARLGISTNTVKTHLELVFGKLGVASRAEAVAVGVRRGVILL